VGNKTGDDKWHYELNDPFPDFRIRSYHMRGISNETPHGVVGGPVIKNRLFIIPRSSIYLDKTPNRTLGFPYNISKHEAREFFHADRLHPVAAADRKRDFHYTPEHTNFRQSRITSIRNPSTPTMRRPPTKHACGSSRVGGGTLDTSLGRISAPHDDRLSGKADRL